MQRKHTRKCAVKECRQSFEPRSMTHKACSPDCAEIIAKQDRENKERKEAAKKRREQAQEKREHRAKKEAAKSRPEWIAEVQTVFNRCVRLRDAHKGCISCDKSQYWDGQWHASHFKSVGANSALRFNLWNVHKSCSVCNHRLSGNIMEYRPRLAERIGPDRVEWLDCHPRGRVYSIEWLKKAKRVFGKLAKRYERRI